MFSALHFTLSPTMFLLLIFANLLQLSYSYNKFNRTCQDLNCLSEETCIIKEDCTSSYSQEQCKRWPTCVPVGTAVKDCSNYHCPPTQMCIIDSGTRKCVAASNSRVNLNENRNPAYSPSAPSLYPDLPSKGPSYPGSTKKPYVRTENNFPKGQGYSGGSIGSGYPGVQTNTGFGSSGPQPAYPTGTNKPYVRTQNSYPTGPGYSGGAVGSGYPGYPKVSGGVQPNPGYPSYPGNYPSYPPQTNYPTAGSYPGYQTPYHPQQYPAGYPGQNVHYGNTYSSSSTTTQNPFVNILKQQVFNIGLFYLSLQLII